MTPHEMAQRYAARGWPVLPLHHPTRFGPKRGPDRALCSCRDDACESQGKHPRTANGLKDSSTDRAVIDSWFDRWPSANVGLLTGGAFDVLDLDGDDALDVLDAAEPPDRRDWSGPIVTTGRGVHLYVAPTGEGNRAAILPGLDFRGTGGYVVAAASRHYSGEPYQWGETFGFDTPIEPCPPWLVRLVRRDVPEARPLVFAGQKATTDSAAERRIAGACGRVAMAAEGNRNAALFWAAAALGGGVADDELDARDVLPALATAAARSGLGETESKATIRSGFAKAGVRVAS